MLSRTYTRTRWLLALGGLLAAAVLLGAVVPSLAAPAPEPAPKEQPKKEEPKKEEPRKPADLDFPFPLPDLDKLFPPGAIDPDQLKEIQKLMDDIRKQMGQLQRMPGAVPGVLPGARRALPLNRPGGKDGSEEGRMGTSIQTPNATLVNQLNLPDKQGIVLKEVKPDSAAAKAGLKDHDILLELDGKPVPSSLDEFQKLLKEIKPDSAVDAVVLRKGKRESIKGLKLPEAKEDPNLFRGLQRFQLVPGANLPQPGQPGLPGAARVQVNNIKITKNADGSFTTSQNQNGVQLTVSGTTENGKAKVDRIEVKEGNASKEYKTVDDVPEAHRDAVKNLIQMSEGNNRLRFNFRQIP